MCPPSARGTHPCAPYPRASGRRVCQTRDAPRQPRRRTVRHPVESCVPARSPRPCESTSASTRCAPARTRDPPLCPAPACQRPTCVSTRDAPPIPACAVVRVPSACARQHPCSPAPDSASETAAKRLPARGLLIACLLSGAPVVIELCTSRTASDPRVASEPRPASRSQDLPGRTRAWPHAARGHSPPTGWAEPSGGGGWEFS